MTLRTARLRLKKAQLCLKNCRLTYLGLVRSLQKRSIGILFEEEGGSEIFMPANNDIKISVLLLPAEEYGWRTLNLLLATAAH